MSARIPLAALSGEMLGRIAKISGQNVFRCMQCGTCTAVCPMSDQMETTPRQTMLLLQHGMVEQAANSKMPWLCASCHNCQVRCPRGLEITRVVEAVRQVMLRDNVDRVNPRQIPREQIKQMPQIALVSGFRKLTA